MSKPIYCTTHPRACSTAFERVFMTRKDLVSVHEPFGDAFYFGPERMSSRFEKDIEWGEDRDFNKASYKDTLDYIRRQGSEGKRVFIKDIAYYLIPPDRQPPKIAPSLLNRPEGDAPPVSANNVSGRQPPFPFATHEEQGNPTIIPQELLKNFHFTFLIRDPHSSIPSYWRCTIPPLDDVTGFYEYYPNEAGYDELRRLFDYLRASSQVGPSITGFNDTQTNGSTDGQGDSVEICVIDADDLLDDPEGIIRKYCASVGLEYQPSMLNWDNEHDQKKAEKIFAKWKGWHEDALDSKDLKPRTHHKAKKSEEQWDAEWKEKYGEDAAKIIRDTVDANMEDFLYLKQFVMKI